MTIERNFDLPLVASLALKEKQIQQNYRPIIAVHKWFARRPGTLFRGLVLSEFGNKPLSEIFFTSNDFRNKTVADPFMGGGTPLIEANRVGCNVLGFDINPMSAWIVREEIEHLDLGAYEEASRSLIRCLDNEIGSFYRTDCPLYGDTGVPVKYFLWVKVLRCNRCDKDIDLFPGYLLAQNRRHPNNVVICSQCGDLNERESLHSLGKCKSCSCPLRLEGPAKRNRCTCPHCGYVNTYPSPSDGPPRHRLFAMEYYNIRRKSEHAGRFFKKPDQRDLARFAAAGKRWGELEPSFVPDQEIPPGDETDRLHRWGYTRYRDLFNDRQLLGLELSCRHIKSTANERVQRALATNLSDLLRYQNMLCRYDAMALKSLDIFSVHGFPVGLIQCESNMIGIANGSGVPVGSGGWINIIEKYIRAKKYCDMPFETQQKNGRKVIIPIRSEWIGEQKNGGHQRKVEIKCISSTVAEIPEQSLDAVFTDPPYFGNVQYAELMDFCYVWLRRLAGENSDGFHQRTTRSPDELTGNATQKRGILHFTEGLSSVYQRMARALKPDAPLAFTFHHNRMEAYHAVGVAILDAGLVCSATIPCPAEMGGSIHIHGTGSSIIDTVFVCRTRGTVKRRLLFQTPSELIELIHDELTHLRAAGMKPGPGDVRCMVYGHVTRMGIWALRNQWNKEKPISERLKRFSHAVSSIGNLQDIIRSIVENLYESNLRIADQHQRYGIEDDDAISF
ncbi:MAG: DNA methylase [Pseudomonadota bacterium]|jgi:putative DNA methylase|uniref:DNA methylase n=1 Tax=anaerobic digester metagenome TaxID=1263854 RepID=A0A485LWE1_9ZZZZ|nr:DNA methylase [Pseudomonadota bacterium]HON39575.1 DNA methylase [Deltaproteobacteria bacterium]HPX19299.1 DNA methylase [Deltaproteobacteria bacterium]